MNITEAKDFINTHGPMSKNWAAADKAKIKSLYNSDPSFAKFLKQQRKIDKKLSKWSEGKNGSDVGEDGGKGDKSEQTELPPEIEMGDGGSGGVDDDSVIEIDFDALKDMDEMFSDSILASIKDADHEEFRVYSRDLDRIIDIPGADSTTIQIDDIERHVQEATGPLQKDLRRLIAARSQVRRSPGQRSGRLHAPNLHRIIAGDDRVFTRRQEAESMETAISLVIDCSGSMAGAELKLAAQTAFAIGTVLDRLNISFECLGFTDDSRALEARQWRDDAIKASAIAPITRAIPLVMPRFKEFGERWNIPVQRRFAHVHNNNGFTYDRSFPFGMTPEGCGVEFAARRLLKRDENRKIMMVMTDGSAMGDSVSGNGTSRYRKQARDVVAAVEASGIDLVGIGIKHDGPCAYYSNSMEINDVKEMPKKLLGILKNLIVN